MDHLERCPHCEALWYDAREIPVVLFEDTDTYATIEEAEAGADKFGWTKENKLRPGANVCGIQYNHTHPEHYDGVSEWQCTVCKTRVGRWSKRVLAESEAEPRFGVKNG